MRLMIADITFEPYEATLPTAVHQHPFGPEGRRCWWVRLTTNCGLTGLGDIAPWPGFSPAAADIGNRLQEYGHLLVGQLISFGSLMSDFWSQFKELPAVVRSGLELAMLDVLAQAKHAPIAALLSPTHARTIQTHRLVNNARDAMEAVSAGF